MNISLKLNPRAQDIRLKQAWKAQITAIHSILLTEHLSRIAFISGQSDASNPGLQGAAAKLARVYTLLCCNNCTHYYSLLAFKSYWTCSSTFPATRRRRRIFGLDKLEEDANLELGVKLSEFLSYPIRNNDVRCHQLARK